MYYLVSFDIDGFVKVERPENEVGFKFMRREDGKALFDVIESDQVYKTQLEEEYTATEFGEFITSIIRKHKLKIMLLHFHTFLVEWGKSMEELYEILIKELSRKDRIMILKVDGPIVSNFSPQEKAVIDILLTKK